MQNKDIKVVVIAGPSGVGKSTIIDGLKQLDDVFEEVTTATTRAPREGEKDGIDYYFLTKEEFKKAKERGDIPEFRYTPSTKNYYGIYLPDLIEKSKHGKILLIDVDIEGVKFLKENFDTFAIFVLPPDEKALLTRIKNRQSDMSDENLKERLYIAKREISEDIKFYDWTIVNETGKVKEVTEKIFNKIKRYYGA